MIIRIYNIFGLVDLFSESNWNIFKKANKFDNTIT